MILLDTNVVSELMRPAPAAAVLGWLRAQRAEDVATTAIALAELCAGLALLPAGARKRDLQSRLDLLFARGFAGRVFGFTAPAASVYGDLFAARQRSGRPAAAFDLLIAAIAVAHGFVVATRNVADFHGCGVPLVNPWTAEV